MDEEVKGLIHIQLGLLQKTMAENNVIIGVMYNKENPQEAKLVFVDSREYMNNNHKGFTITRDELNKHFLGGNNERNSTI